MRRAFLCLQIMGKNSRAPHHLLTADFHLIATRRLILLICFDKTHTPDGHTPRVDLLVQTHLATTVGPTTHDGPRLLKIPECPRCVVIDYAPAKETSGASPHLGLIHFRLDLERTVRLSEL